MENPVRKMLVYIDGSDASVAAAQYAVVLGKVLRAELTALFVVNTRAIEDLVKSRIFLQTEDEEYTRDIEKDADRYLAHVKNLGLQKGVVVRTVKRHGTPSLEIKAELKAWGVDLFVIGEISKIRSRHDEFYNESERAIRNVQCSVLIVKDEDRVWNVYESLQ